MLEILLVVLLILVFLLVAYKGAIHEFQILQKDWKPTIDWSSLLSEQLPLVVRNVDPTWQAAKMPWTAKAVAGKTWPVQLRKDGALFKGRWNEWLANPGQPPLTPETWQEISAIIAPPLPMWEDGGFHRWSWIPAHLARPLVQILTTVQPVRRTTAATTLIQATDGAPLTLWLAHEGAIPAKVATAIKGKDPWSLTAEQVPWISEVKFIELRLRPGNAIAIPTHWYWAAKPHGGQGQGQGRGQGQGQGEDVGNSGMAEGSWYWIAEWQTPVSWLVSSVQK
jgi:hypothetical protein